MILVIVFDGLRPDQITSLGTPNLYGLAQRGVHFLSHHATFPTHTRVNVASLFTGCYPGRHGLVSNYMYLPELDPTWEISTGDYTTIHRLEDLMNGGFVMAKTLGELLHAQGKTMTAIGVGSSGNAALHHHKAGSLGGAVVHPDFTVPASLGSELEARFGSWPDVGLPNDARIQRAVTILLEYLIPTYRPAVATLWMPDPDSAQHKTGVGSPVALEAIGRADGQLGRILHHLEATGLVETTDLLILSGHGHSTVTEVVDVAFADRLFDGLLPWAKLREGPKLIRLGERYTPERLDAACKKALCVASIASFRQNQLPLGSGAVERGHCHVVQAHLEFCGAWGNHGVVNPMLAPRTPRVNGWWESFWRWAPAPCNRNAEGLDSHRSLTLESATERWRLFCESMWHISEQERKEISKA